ncbi:Ski complex subunit Rec14 [Coniosporium apollinis]|uniref:Ski complex subunit Rec14 n=1 Tax=Coniosporium apollinis TaxID=61459 RepID=A0ABQ9NTQ2_9PEZI|nr:Ski complex subunit Rec14 [Coniosporium apollinis]
MAAIRHLASPPLLRALLPVSNAPLRPVLGIPVLRHIHQNSLFPSITLPIPVAAIAGLSSIFNDIWESILRAVPKKKTSHMKKRQRQMASGKHLKDVTELNKSIKHWFKEGSSEATTTGAEKSKQYLTVHTLENAHPTDVFSIAPTKIQLLSASGSSTIRIHSTTEPDFPQIQTLDGVHKLGCHHIVTSSEGKRAASAGFGGEVKFWACGEDGQWTKEDIELDVPPRAGELWAVALSGDGRYLASSSYDGKVSMWDLAAGDGTATRIRHYETKGSFGTCVDISTDAALLASGHQNGSLHIFNNTTSRLLHSLPGLLSPIRAIRFSPLTTLLAAGGDSRIIGLYDVRSGEQVAQLLGHQAWIMSLDWSDTGEWLLSGAWDGKAKVWRTETRECVATQGFDGGTVWAGRWLPRVTGMPERFTVAGQGGGIGFLREASGSG